MTYPEAVDRFVEKLNKADIVYVIEDEELVLEDGVFEGELAHDNVKNESVIVFTGPKMNGERIENFFLSIPSNAPWKRIIKVFANAPKVYVTYETTGDQVEAEDINRVQDSIVNTQIELERYKSVNDQVVEGINVRLTTAENNKAERTYVDTELLKKADKATTYTKTETDDRIQAIIGAAPEALDTLAEIAEALNNDPDFAATITNELATKVDKVAGKGLSTEDYTTAEKTKLAGIEEGANKYIHPASHPASMIVESTDKQFVSAADKAKWDAKETPEGAQEKANAAETNAKSYTDEHDQDTTKHITATERTNWNDANSKKHTHSNKSILDIITQTLIDAWNSAVDHISDAVKHITSAERASWNAKETPAGAQAKADIAEQNAKNYADNKIDDLAGEGRTTETVKEVADDLVSHKANTTNPHNVTKSQVGLANVDNVKQASKTEFDSHNNDTTRHITTEERTRWNNKAEVSQIPTKVSQLENDRGYVTQEELGDAGYGDMMKAVYDTNDDGIVDVAETVIGNEIQLGSYKLVYNSTTNSLDIEVIS